MASVDSGRGCCSADGGHRVPNLEDERDEAPVPARVDVRVVAVDAQHQVVDADPVMAFIESEVRRRFNVNPRGAELLRPRQEPVDVKMRWHLMGVSVTQWVTGGPLEPLPVEDGPLVLKATVGT